MRFKCRRILSPRVPPGERGRRWRGLEKKFNVAKWCGLQERELCLQPRIIAPNMRTSFRPKLILSLMLLLSGLMTATAQAFEPEALFGFPLSPQHPFANLVQGPDGIFYGTTENGGPGGGGTIFRLVMPRFSSAARQAGGSLLLAGTGPPNEPYRLWGAANLSLPFMSWTILITSSFRQRREILPHRRGRGIE